MTSRERKPGPPVANKDLAAVLMIAAAAFLVYGGTLGNAFVFDDRLVVENNAFIRSWDNLPDLFNRNYFIRSGELSYRPVVTLSYFLDYRLWHSRPAGYHLTNVILHSLNAVLVFCLIRLLFFRPAPAFICGLIFALHPVNSEAVCAVAFREDLLVLLFSLLSLIFYRRLDPAAGKRKNSLFLAVSLLSFALALLAKEMAMVLPLILLLTDLVRPGEEIPDRRNNGKKWRRYAGFYLFVFAGYLAVRFHWLRLAGPETVPGLGKNLFQQLLAQSTIFLTYLKLLLFPIDLDILHPVFPAVSPGPAGVVLGLFAWVGMLAGAVWCFRRRPEIFFGISYFLIFLLPVSNIVPLKNPLTERYLYAPGPGFFLILSAGFEELIFRTRRRPGGRLIPAAAIVLLFCLLAFYSAAAFLRTRDWRVPTVFYERIVRRHPESSFYRANLGYEYQREGRKEEAREQYEAALGIDPFDVVAHNGLGSIYGEEKNYSEAERHYQAVKTVRPDYVPAWHNLGVLYYRAGRYREAAAALERETQLSPFSAGAHFSLGQVLEKLGDSDRALAAYERAAELEPADFEIHYRRAALYDRLEKVEEAIAAYRKVLELNPGQARSHYRLGTFYAVKGQLEAARKELETAVKLDRNNAAAWNNLGGVCRQLGREEEARAFFEKALILDPKLAEARKNMESPPPAEPDK